MRDRLSRRRVLEAALRIVDSEGLNALTMRRLGRELGVEAMSLYRHVPNKDALLDGIVELIVLEIEVPHVDGDWKEAARQIVRSYRRAAHSHPNAFPLVTMRPLNTPEGLRRLDATFEILRRAGLDEPTAIVAFRTLASYTRGFALEEVTGRAIGAEPLGSDRLDPRALPADEFPRLAELAPRLVAADRDAEFERGVDLILTGLEAGQ
ncbi:MAG: Tetracyclin repressor, C-terminal all-alpha domain [Gaiellaceae bacterium]|jgi:AcrR family transcriptional regulator|nr:Tetracyclin repressor, C-terminal all-alpha domain [Gaiellaceae bacterium]